MCDEQRHDGTSRIHIQGVTQRIGRHVIIQGMDLDLGIGVFGLLGPNGAGKTTLLRTVATILSPSSGRIALLGLHPGMPAQLHALRRQIGYLPQAFGYFPDFTVTDFIRYIALLREVPANRAPAAAREAIGRLGLERQAHVRLKTLSGGTLRRVGIAQALVNDPAILLLDEPTVGLDPEQRIALRALLREVGTTSTVILSTHLVEDVAAACAEVLLLREGRLVFRGTPANLAAEADGVSTGDSALERGYSAVIHQVCTP